MTSPAPIPTERLIKLSKLRGDKFQEEAAMARELLSLRQQAQPTREEGWRVKGLVWGGNGVDVFYTTSVLGTFIIRHDADEPEEWSYQLGTRIIGYARDEVEAKALVQAYHDARISSALLPIDAPAHEGGGETKLIDDIINGTAPMSKWMGSVDYSTYDGFEEYLKTQLREKMDLKVRLDKKRHESAEDESLATFVDGGSGALEAALATYRTVRERVAAASPAQTREAVLEEALNAVQGEQLDGDTDDGSDRAYMRAIEHASDAIRALASSPAPEPKQGADGWIEVLRNLTNSADGMSFREDAIRNIVGNTNWRTLRDHIAAARAILPAAPTSTESRE